MNKKIPPSPAVFPSVPKGRKGEKEIGHSKLNVRGARVQRRENVGGSLNLWSPQMLLASIIGFNPFDDFKYSIQKSIRQVSCQNFFLVYFFEGCFCILYLGNGTHCFRGKYGIKSRCARTKG